jgi:flagellar biosynthesis chaperone FliJ
MTQFIYRLEQLLEIKEDARAQREKELQQREKELEAQKARLQSLEKRVQELITRRQRLRREVFTPGSGGMLAAQEAKERFEYTQVLGLQIEEASNDVRAQRTVLEQCEEQVRRTQQALAEANREVEILKKHRSKQEERFLRDERVKEDLALDEIGNVLYSTRRQPS